MAEELKVVITGTGTSAEKTFLAVDRAAGRMGQTVEDSSRRAGRSLQDFNARAAALGAAIGTVAGVMSEWSREAIEEEAIFARLEQAVETSGDAYSVFSSRIEEAITAGERLAFADDQTASSLATLTSITQDTELALDAIGVAMDLARDRGLSLEQASTILGRAMEGSTVQLQRMGIAVRDGATAQEVLATVSARTAGQAVAYAETQAGAIDKLRNRWDEITETVATSTGEFQTVLALLPGLSIGFTTLSTAIGGLTGGAGVGGLVRVLGPAGLVAAVGLASFKLLEFAGEADSRYVEGMGNAEAATDDLRQALEELFAAGDPTALIARPWQTAMDGIVVSVETMVEKVRDGYAELNDGGLNTGNMAHAVGEEVDALTAEWEKLGLSMDTAEAELRETDAALALISKNSGPGAEMAVRSVDQAFADLAAGRINLQQFFDRIQQIADLIPVYDERAAQLDAFAEAQDGAFGPGAQANLAGHSQALRDEQVTLSALNSELRTIEGARPFDQIGKSAQESAEEVAYWTARLDEARQSSIAFVDDAENIDDILFKMGKTLSGEQGIIKISQSVELAQRNLDSLFSVVAGGTDALGQSSQQAADWIGDLTDNTSYLDTALKSGRISQEEYNAVLAAESTIVDNNAAAQAHLDTIRAKQAPLIAEQVDAYEDYLQTLSELPAAEQRQALAFVDTGTKAQIAGSYATAYAASLGEIPEDVATEMILSDAQSSPILKETLLAYGLIEEGADGVLRVNFPDADTLTETIDRLTDSINDLGRIIANPRVVIDTSDPDAKLPVLVSDVEEIDAMIATPTVQLFDGASGPLSAIMSNLQFIDGFTATTYVDTVNRNIGGGLAGLFQHGGIVPAVETAQHGITSRGRLALVGESGPELVRLPPLAQVSPSPASRETLATMAGQRPIEVHIHGNVYGVSDLNRAMDDALRRARLAESRS